MKRDKVNPAPSSRPKEPPGSRVRRARVSNVVQLAAVRAAMLAKSNQAVSLEGAKVLYEAAAAGDIRGFAFVAITSDGRGFMDAIGVVREDLHRTRSMLFTLYNDLEEIVAGEWPLGLRWPQ